MRQAVKAAEIQSSAHVIPTTAKGTAIRRAEVSKVLTGMRCAIPEKKVTIIISQV
jgi:hypothetical protein